MRLATPIPAQLTKILSCPFTFRAAASAASTQKWGLLRHVAFGKRAGELLGEFSPTVAALRSRIATFTPLAANALAVAAPSPEAPPVTTAEMSFPSCMFTPLPVARSSRALCLVAAQYLRT